MERRDWRPQVQRDPRCSLRRNRCSANASLAAPRPSSGMRTTISPSSFRQALTQLHDDASYDNVLPSIDFYVEPPDNLVVRASWSKTIARADYGQLFVADSAGTPPRATALGGIAGGNRGNTALVPLESRMSTSPSRCTTARRATFRWGSSTRTWRTSSVRATSRNLFGFRDVSSGSQVRVPVRRRRNWPAIPGALRNDVNMFVHDGDVRESEARSRIRQRPSWPTRPTVC